MRGQGFAASKRDWAMLRAAGASSNALTPEEVARILRAPAAGGGLSPAMALARRCEDGAIVAVLTEAAACLDNPGPNGLTVGNAELFFRLLAQRMAPRTGLNPAADIAQMPPLAAARLADVLALEARASFLFGLRQEVSGLAVGDPRIVEALRRPEPTAAALIDGTVRPGDHPGGVSSGLLGAAALRAATSSDVVALIDRVDALYASPSADDRALGMRVAGLLAQRQSGSFRSVAPIATATLDTAAAARLTQTVSREREVTSYMSGGPGVPPARAHMSRADIDAFLAFADTQTGNVGGEVVTREVAAQLVSRWLGDPAWIASERDPLAALDRHGDNRALHRARWSEGKAVSGGVGTLNLMRFGSDGAGNVRQLANVHLNVPRQVVVDTPRREVA